MESFTYNKHPDTYKTGLKCSFYKIFKCKYKFINFD